LRSTDSVTYKNVNNQLYRRSAKAVLEVVVAVVVVLEVVVVVACYTSSAQGKQLYKQHKHRQPVTLAAQAQATKYSSSARTSKQLYSFTGKQ
jgi:predicted membrane-bound mannosyltransferase